MSDKTKQVEDLLKQIDSTTTFTKKEVKEIVLSLLKVVDVEYNPVVPFKPGQILKYGSTYILTVSTGESIIVYNDTGYAARLTVGWALNKLNEPHGRSLWKVAYPSLESYLKDKAIPHPKMAEILQFLISR